jgi:voltage-gated potassium channel
MKKVNIDYRIPLGTLVGVAVIAASTETLSYFGRVSVGEAFYDTLHLLLSHISRHDYTDPVSETMTILLIVLSYVVIAYLLKALADYMMGLQVNVRRARTRSKVEKLRNHYIVCGLGRVGSQVAREMFLEGVPFVALDRDEGKVQAALDAGYLAMQLDSIDEEALTQAGIKHAEGLVAGLGEDSQNLLVTLSARSLNPDLYIVARANRPESEIKLKRAGADRVAMPYQIGGYHMASMVLRPNVVDYMDVVPARGNGDDLVVEEMIVGDHSKLAGKRLGKGMADEDIKATVIAINGADGTSRVRPTGMEMIYAGDRLIVLGSKPDLNKASALIR